MASPQAEQGHVDIANELVDKFSNINLSAYQWRVLWFIFRKTYGWHKKADRISYTQFEQGTGLPRRHVARTLKQLIGANMVSVFGNGQLLEYAFQKDWEVWTLTPRGKATVPYKGNSEPFPIKGTEPFPIKVQPFPIKVTKPFPIKGNTKEKKETIQKKKKETETFDQYRDKLRLRFTALDFDIELEKYNLYWNEGRRKLKNPKLALLNWMSKAQEFLTKGGIEKKGQPWVPPNRQLLTGDELEQAWRGKGAPSK
jgi:phage replication O-like protein O